MSAPTPSSMSQMSHSAEDVVQAGSIVQGSLAGSGGLFHQSSPWVPAPRPLAMPPYTFLLPEARVFLTCCLFALIYGIVFDILDGYGYFSPRLSDIGHWGWWLL